MAGSRRKPAPGPARRAAMSRRLALLMLLAAAPRLAPAQQEPDTAFRPPIAAPAWPPGRGPLVLVDEGHANFHTANGRYRPFADLLRRDGFVVRGSGTALHPGGLDGVAVLVIANAIGPAGGPAFSAAEVTTLRTWVAEGGSLLLIADHMPFPGAMRAAGEAFGFEFVDGFAAGTGGEPGPIVFRSADGTLGAHPAVSGRTPAERVDSVVSFTGHAFRGAGATPLLVLGPGAVHLLPREPWVFDSTAVRRSAAGWWQGAAKEVGQGRVAVFGEAAMFTAQLAGSARIRVGMNAPEAAHNPRFLLNLMHWLADGPA
jgi:hypothetical protein